MPPPRASSGEHAAVDPALILAIRNEIDAAVAPVTERLDKIDERLGKGDTALALMNQRIDTQESRNKTTERTSRGMNPLLVAAITGALSTGGSLFAVWFLTGLGQAASKGSP